MRLLLLILTLAGIAAGQDPSPADVLGSIRHRYQGLRDASAHFTQTVQRRYGRAGAATTGTVQIKHGNKYRIETDRQVIVTDGAKVWMYTPRTKQVLIDNYSAKRQTFSPDQFLQGLPKELTPVSAVHADSSIVLTLTPARPDGAMKAIASVSVRTVPGRWTIDHIEMTEKNGTVTAITLREFRMNTGIADGVFRFAVTDSMNVVDVNALR
ncbi:MAG: outer membrane lipoprotein carrier protein LolA [Bacteroidetes bacterium]|nr:outer membrane lipoprotein carrier protein LolA [Bacteroidota bacterium]